MKERLALDTRKWLPKVGEDVGLAKQRASEDLAYAIREQLDTKDLKKCINSGSFVVNEKGKLENPLFGEIENVLRNETNIDRLENEAFRKIQDWANSEDEGVVVWISPPLDGVYSEARIVVNEIETKDLDKCVVFRAIRSNLTSKECVEVANKLYKGFKEAFVVIDADEVRKSPIPLSVPKNMHWTEVLGEIVPENEIWNVVRNNEDIKELKKARVVAEKIIYKSYKYLKLSNNAHEHLVAGAFIEDLAREEGYSMQLRGSCGVSNNLALKRSLRGVFTTKLDNKIDGEKSWGYTRGVCVVCKNESLVGPCSVCVSCENKF
jgi:hypothetical protein